MGKLRCGLLYVDILGTKKLWQTRGIAPGQGRIDLFANIVEQGLESANRQFHTRLIQGKVWTDSAGLLFESVDDAILTGMAIYQVAFSRDDHNSDARVYLRGIITRSSAEALDSSIESSKKLPGLERIMFSQEQVDATILENSGFRGLRLIGSKSDLSQKVVTDATARYWDRTEYERGPSVTGGLVGNLYPQSEGGFSDVLWPIGPPETFKKRRGRLLERYSASNGDSEEKRQLRPTNALFNLVERIIDTQMSA